MCPLDLEAGAGVDAAGTGHVGAVDTRGGALTVPCVTVSAAMRAGTGSSETCAFCGDADSEGIAPIFAIKELKPFSDSWRPVH